MIFRAPYKEVTIPEVPLTRFVLQRFHEHSDKPALIEGPTGRTITYGELAQAIQRAAAGLAARGFKKGDVLGILSPNLPEYAIAFHAVATLGGITTPINPVYTVEEVGHQLRDAGAKYLVTVPETIEKALSAAKIADIKETFVFGALSEPGADRGPQAGSPLGVVDATGPDSDEYTPFNALLESNGIVPDVEINPREDLVVLPYSSGTTGLPKGVMLTHYNLVANLSQMEGLEFLLESDTLVCFLPWFHIYGLVVVMNFGLYTGATLVTMPRFKLEQFLEIVQKHRVTLAH